MELVRRIKGDPKAAAPRSGDVRWLGGLARGRRAGPAMNARPSLGEGVSTLAVHGGSGCDPATGAVGTPIYQNTTFLLGDSEYEAFDQGHARDKFIYSRYGNPSQWAVQEKLASLENAESALVFSSGMAAIATTILALVDHGGHVVASNELYGGTYSLLNMELPNMGMSATLVDPTDLAAIEQAIGPQTQILFFEAITNPLLKVIDLGGLAKIAERHGVRLVVDATFMTPAVCRPLDYGVDIVLHSATKYLNGHSDLTAGVATGSRKLIDLVWARMLALGGCLDPHGCFLLERGLKTLGVRMRAHSENALALARYLEAHSRIEQVHHPLMLSHPQQPLARKLMKQGTGVITFVVDGGDEKALEFMNNLRIPHQATSLGGVESLISMPFNSSQSGFTSKQREGMGILPGCIRLSVGIEDKDDIIADFEQAFSRTYRLGLER